MRELFKEDYYRMTGTVYETGLRSLAQWFISHQIRYVYWWRRANKSPNILNRIILKRYSKKYGLEISTGAKIGRGLYLGHPYNITVGGGVKIGDNVAIGINATVIGNIHIGNDVMIASNSFVNFDVPDHSIVIGNPGVIHHKENATEGYIAFCIK